MRVLVTGSEGFIGKNLISRLETIDDVEVLPVDISTKEEQFVDFIQKAELIYHLAGVNRPKTKEEFYSGNRDITTFIVNTLKKVQKTTPIIFSSSIQAERDNDYGISKRLAENILFEYIQNGGEAYIYRLKNVFGKWCQPNYNSVVATFCHNIANNKDIEISNPDIQLELNYIDDVVEEFLSYVFHERQKILMNNSPLSVKISHTVKLGELADTLYEFKRISINRVLPNLEDDFTKKLYSTFLSYVPYQKRSVAPELRADNRGNLFELLKSRNSGQIFVSKTKPGIVRGNHYHHTKIEKFCVISGKAIIRLRKISGAEVETYNVDGETPQIVDIPPGYTHNIENIGESELITLFWANEMFNPEKPDTYFKEV